MTSETFQQEFRELVAAAKFTLAESYDPQTRIAKDFSELVVFHQKQAPNVALAQPPKELDIAILSFSDRPPHRIFLSMLEKALTLKFNKKVKMVSSSEWETARFLIAPDYGIASDPYLSKKLVESGPNGQPLLGSTPLFLLTDLSLYMKEPKLKSSLWKALCQELKLLK